MLKSNIIIKLIMMVLFSLASIGVVSVLLSQSKSRNGTNLFQETVLAKSNNTKCINNY